VERVCREWDLGFTADSLIPPEHRGRVTFLEFQRYFSRLPDAVVFNETSTTSSSSLYESLRKRGTGTSKNVVAYIFLK
jgi:hypothetical protein